MELYREYEGLYSLHLVLHSGSKDGHAHLKLTRELGFLQGYTCVRFGRIWRAFSGLGFQVEAYTIIYHDIPKYTIIDHNIPGFQG